MHVAFGFDTCVILVGGLQIVMLNVFWKYSVASAFYAAISYCLSVPVYISANSAEQLGLAGSRQTVQNFTACHVRMS